MGRFVINGGRRLLGEVAIGGCKNAVLPILAATLLTGKCSIIHNCPAISDTYVSIDILRHLGCDVAYDGEIIIIDSTEASDRVLPGVYTSAMRSSVLFAGSLLSRFGRFEMAYPGGCELGARPIDLHLMAFEKMGAKIDNSENRVIAKAKKLEGTKINLDFPSVGATQNAILAAVLAKGKTIITNAAKEPEIADLQGYLQVAGARIFGAGTSVIIIEGVKQLRDVEYKIMPDRIVAGTYLVAGAITRGHVRVANVNPKDLEPVTHALEKTGAKLQTYKNTITLKMQDRPINIPKLITSPHPGFPTDVQQQITSLLAVARGESIIEEKLFDARDAHIAELVKMGANIKNVDNNRFEINGVVELFGTDVYAKDLRGGAALVIAGLAANGQTVVHNAEYIQRGYEAMNKDLQSLGADITLT